MLVLVVLRYCRERAALCEDISVSAKTTGDVVAPVGPRNTTTSFLLCGPVNISDENL